MTMEVKKVKYKNTKLYKTQTEVTYSERGNGVQMIFYTAPNHTYREFIFVPFWSEMHRRIVDAHTIISSTTDDAVDPCVIVRRLVRHTVCDPSSAAFVCRGENS